MRNRIPILVLLVGALAALPAAAAGQIAWDTPRLIGPNSPGGFGAYWLRAGSLPGDGDAAMVTWTLPGLGGAVSVRGGGGTGAADEIAGFGGIDVRTPLARHGDDQPLDLEWTAGLGVGVGDYLLVSVPMGISAGRSWTSGAVWLAPYVSLGVALDVSFGDQAPDDEFDVTPAADIGMDLSLDPGRHFILRIATSLGDRQALVVGASVGGGE